MTYRVMCLCLSGYNPGLEADADFTRFVLVLISDVEQITQLFSIPFLLLINLTLRGNCESLTMKLGILVSMISVTHCVNKIHVRRMDGEEGKMR